MSESFQFSEWLHEDPLCWNCATPTKLIRWCPVCGPLRGELGGPVCKTCAEEHWDRAHLVERAE